MLGTATPLHQREDFVRLRAEGLDLRTSAAQSGLALVEARVIDAHWQRTSALNTVNRWLDKHKRHDDYDLPTALTALDDAWNAIITLARTF